MSARFTRLHLRVVSSQLEPGRLSLRLDARPGGRLAAADLKAALLMAGFKPGDRVALVTTSELRALDRAWKRSGEA